MGREQIVFEIDGQVVGIPRARRALESGGVPIRDPEALALRPVLEEEGGERPGPAAEELPRALAA
jgi:hypothetical protein